MPWILQTLNSNPQQKVSQGARDLEILLDSVIIVSGTRRGRDIKIPFCLSSPVQKFNVVSSDHGRMQKCDFSVLGWEYFFYDKFGPKNFKNVSLS